MRRSIRLYIQAAIKRRVGRRWLRFLLVLVILSFAAFRFNQFWDCIGKGIIRFAVAVRKRGIKVVIKGKIVEFRDLLYIIVSGHWFDLKYGTDTMQWHDLDGLEIKSDNKSRGQSYEPTPTRPFMRLMRMLSLPADSVFVDLGSGKGRSLLLASAYGFKKLVGVEFSHQLCEVARRNVFIFTKRSGVRPCIEIVESDVVDYEIKDDENVFYFYNPFDATVMGKVIDNICISLIKNPRKIWIIYNHPVHRDIIEGQGNFVSLLRYPHSYSECIVYTNAS